MATRENEPSSIVNIIYKIPLANGSKTIRIEMNISPEIVFSQLDVWDETTRFIQFKDMYNQEIYIPVDNIGEMEVY